jgi:glutamate 5-kinase
MDQTKPTTDDTAHRPLAYHRIVVKAGTNVLTGGTAQLDRDTMASLAWQIADVCAAGAQVVLVTSGAIAAGREAMGKAAGAKGVGLSQMLAAVGQSRLMHTYEELFSGYHVTVAQALLTRQDVEDRVGYLNLRNALDGLLAHGVVPIVNENDLVDTAEISQERFGDNDTLSAIVANLIDADLLLILSDVAGLYSADPNRVPDAELIPFVEQVDASILALAEAHRSKTTRGGMLSKLLAAQRATASGVSVVIAGGHEAEVVRRVASGERIGTMFAATATALESRKRWLLSGTAEHGGVLVLDAGAVSAICKDAKSLLPAGVRGIQGTFRRGDVVAVAEPDGERIAYGIANYDADDLRKILGAKSADIADLIGHHYGDEAIHRDNMVVL